MVQQSICIIWSTINPNIKKRGYIESFWVGTFIKKRSKTSNLTNRHSLNLIIPKITPVQLQLQLRFLSNITFHLMLLFEFESANKYMILLKIPCL